MWYKTVEHTQGTYSDKEGKKYILIQCHRAMDKDGRKNKELGLTEFNSLEECLETWQLTKIENHGRTTE